jgi:uncharacterized Zn-binding protein involved in type VI secretion
VGQPAARATDMHTCPLFSGPVPHVGGPIASGMPTVLSGKLPQARVSDPLVCVGPPDVIVKGSPTVMVGGLMAARMGDNTAHGGVIVVGCPTVLIGDKSSDGGGGGGAPGNAASNSGTGLLTSGPTLAVAAAQTQVLIDAAREGTPFCERCAQAA